MNFGEWTEKKRKENSFLPGSGDLGGSFGSQSGTVARPNVGRGGGIVSTPAAATDYAGEMRRLQEQRRQAAVDMDMDAVNAADNAMKAMRAQMGKQTFGDRVGDAIGAAAAGTAGSAASSMLTEKLGNTGLFKSTYGKGLLDDETLDTLSRLALSSVSEGAEEFAEGLFRPALQRVTYDPDAVYDDEWLNDTLYDTGVGAVLGGIGGRVGTQASTQTKSGEYRETRPQNVEYPTVPIISMSRQQYAASNGKVPDAGNALRTDAVRRARRRLRLDQNPAAYIPAGNVTRNGEEYVLKVTKSSLNKMLSPAHGESIPLESILVLDNLERIANNGVWKKSEGDRKNRTQIQGFDHLMTTVYIDNEPYVADLRVRLVREAPDKKTDNVLYYFTPEEILNVKKADASSYPVKRRAPHVVFKDSASAK